MPVFTVDSCTYRNGEKPVAVGYATKQFGHLTLYSIRVTELGCCTLKWHHDDGSHSIGQSDYDLILPPPPPRPWACESDLLNGVERMRFNEMNGQNLYRRNSGSLILAVVADGVYLTADQTGKPTLFSWELIEELKGEYLTRGSSEWLPCTTVAPMPGQGVGE
jgi:hypothetical protein